MISEKAIIDMANKLQTTELNVLREYFQHSFLSGFYRLEESGSIFFKGGTALRLIYKSPRFSEDLDFSANTYSISKIEDAVLGALMEVGRENIETDISDAKKTSGGYLASILFGKNPGLSIKIEISLREKQINGGVFNINSSLALPYSVVALDKKEIVRQKLKALMERKKARDFYDLYFLLRADMVGGLLKGKKEGLIELVRRSRGMDFEKELKRFLPKAHWKIIKELPKALMSELERI